MATLHFGVLRAEDDLHLLEDRRFTRLSCAEKEKLDFLFVLFRLLNEFVIELFAASEFVGIFVGSDRRRLCAATIPHR